MQTQAQAPGQAPSQAARVQQNGNSVSAQNGNVGGTFKRTWHTEDDVGLRRGVCEHILHLFKKRKPQVTPEWQQRLPEFVKRLEEALYLSASSKEEYSDLGTLENRLQLVAKRIVVPARSQHSSTVVSASTMIPTPGSAGNMMPTPGNSGNIIQSSNGMNMHNSGNGHGSSKVPSGGMMVPTPGLASSLLQTQGNSNSMMQSPSSSNAMIPTPGGIGSIMQGGTMAPPHGSNLGAGGMGKMLQSGGHGGSMYPNSVGHVNALANQQVYGSMRVSQNGQVASSIGSQMIPTPGLAQSMGTNSASVGAVSMTNSGPQQQYSGGPSSQGYRTMNGQLGTNLNCNLQRKGSANSMPMLSNGQHLVNGGHNLHHSTGYGTPYANMPLQPPQQQQQQQQIRVGQQRHQQLRLQGDGYPMSQAELTGSGSLYPASSAGLMGPNMNGGPMGSQAGKMIPVPGLPPQQGMLQQQLQQPQQLPIHRTNMQQNTGMNRGQQLPIQMAKNQSMFSGQQTSNVVGQKPQGGTLPMDQPQVLSSASFQQAGDQHQSPRTQMPPQQQQQQQMASMHHPQRQNLQSNMMAHQQHLRQQQTQRLQQPLQVQLKQQQQQQLPLQAQQQQLSSQQQQQSHQSMSPAPSQVQGLTQQLQPQGQPVQQLPQEQQQMQSQQQVQQNVSQQPLQQVPRPFTPAQTLSQKPQMLHQGSMNQPQGLMNQQEDLMNQQQNGGGAHLQQQPQPLTAVSNAPAAGDAMAPAVGPDNAHGNGVQGSEGTDAQRAQQYLKQRRWLLFLRHASKCQAPEGQCQTTQHCHVARELWLHLAECRVDHDCPYTRCTASKTLVRHYQQCREPRCPVCAPVRQYLSQSRPPANGQVQPGQSQPPTTSPQAPGQVGSVGSPNLSVPPSGQSSMGTVTAASPQVNAPTPTQGVEGEDIPPSKKAKLDHHGASTSQQQSVPQSMHGPSGRSQLPSMSGQQNLVQRPQGSKVETPLPSKMEMPVKLETDRPGSHQLGTELQAASTQRQKQSHTAGLKVEAGGQASGSVSASTKDQGNISAKQSQGSKPASSSKVLPSQPPAAKSGKPKIVGTSLAELFTAELIMEHINGLRQWVGQSKAKAEKNQAMEHQMTENSCCLCAVEKLTFEPPPIYCTACGIRIKRNCHFYTIAAGETRHYCCTGCYNECRTENIDLDTSSFPKTKFEKRRNDEETEEAWVQCDKCNKWQHQVCALFNGRRNEGGDAEYTCPKCLMNEIIRGERNPLPPSAVLGAKDLPKTLLSDQLESRLARKLDSERQRRAELTGKPKDEVPGAEALVVRVVSCVDKKLEVKPRFLEMFQSQDYPTEFSYKSKVVVLFQKIEGVEVCLFGMYVQEFGSECAYPNERRVYLSYLDSVKYFRPEVKTWSGEALRTFVYHEILIGYLDHCKNRGFSSCYIWACPPLKGEDYILYCHPEIQKTPKSDKLREWYLTMLKKASQENIVVEVTNLYDYFFIPGDSKAKVTASRLPYFDGDYWPGAAEEMILQLKQEDEEGRKMQKKGKTKKQPTKRSSKAGAQAELAHNASDDAKLMYKMGESIYHMKEDFIMVHLHHSCSHCRTFIISGLLWSCETCKNFKLCNRCYESHQMSEDQHPVGSKETHLLLKSEVADVPADTRDKDEIIESEFFDTRQAFLSLCQGNHYQYDTLRRAKHSSMMVLYHLHNPAAPAFVVSCNTCNRDIESGQGWRCEKCVDFDLCSSCKETTTHEHKLVMHSERNAQNKEARQMRVLQLRKMLELLVHASQCSLQLQCGYPKCHSVKVLFRHGMYCAVRASGGCNLCKRMWYLLQLHARACKEAVCRVPRCKDLKEHLRRLTQQAESRRRAAVNEMMRQRAAETAGNTG